MKYGLDGAFPLVWIGGGNIELGGERGVEGIGLHAEGIDALIGPMDRGKIVIVEVRGGRADLDHAEATLANDFETIKDALLVETAC
jgi:hypothetical protein